MFRDSSYEDRNFMLDLSDLKKQFLPLDLSLVENPPLMFLPAGRAK
jgi:hypothetical protein